MKPNWYKTLKSTLLATILLCFLTSIIHADIVAVGGAVVIAEPPANIALHQWESNTEIRTFFERQTTLESDLTLDHVNTGVVNDIAQLVPGVIGAGTEVRSFMFRADTVGTTEVTFSGYAIFNTEILGVFVQTSGLNASDSHLGRPGIEYGTHDTRGLELASSQSLDSITISLDRRRIDFNLLVSGADDNVRVVTAVPTVTEIVIADSVADYSDVQGQDNWYYGYYDGPYNPTGFKLMTEFGVFDNSWTVNWNPPGPRFYTLVGRGYMHPNGPGSSTRSNAVHFAVRRWISPVEDNIKLIGNVKDGDVNPHPQDDGVDFRLFLDGTQVFMQPVNKGTEHPFLIPLAVQQGSILDFAIAPRAYASWDSTNFNVKITMPASQVVGAHVFHGDSFFDADGVHSAIDHGKVLLREEGEPQTLGMNHLINSSKGINGILFEFDKLSSQSLTASDFVFQVSPQGAFDEAANPPDEWDVAPAPSSIDVTGESPSNLIIRWPNHSIENRWLRITINANSRTGLAEPETYYIGHLLGETTGPTDGVFTVSFADITPIRAEVGQSVDASSITDIDKNGTVSFADISAMRGNVGSQLTQISVP